MPKFIFSKLVRDTIPKLYEALGQRITTRPLTHVERIEKLRDKLQEETDELPIQAATDSHVIDEIADIQEVLDEIKVQYGVTDEQVREARNVKHKKKGGFSKAVYVETIELRDDDKEWIEYYRREPMKYSEVRINETHTASTIPPGVYKHYKGNTYEVFGLGCHTETGEHYAVYRLLRGQTASPDLWLRPYAMFVETVTVDGRAVPRFQRID